MKFSKKLMACGLAVVMVTTCSGTSDVAFAAKKPSISQKKVTITAGKKKTIKVKNANKTVKWSSSKKKVVTVKGSGKKKAIGTLKGVSKGTATVVAKVGSKKLKCKVTVKKASSTNNISNVATNIQSVAVDPLDEQCVVLNLKKAETLNVSDLRVDVKEYKEGSYHYTPTIKTITTDDSKSYRIYINANIVESDWVRVIIKGKDSGQAQYKKDIVGATQDVHLKKNKTVRIAIDRSGYQEGADKKTGGDLDFDEKYYTYFAHAIGTVAYSCQGNLPEGLILDSERGIIKGIPTKVGEYPVTIKATDELGRSATANITFKVYDDKTITVSDVSDYVRKDSYTEKVTSLSGFRDDEEVYSRVLIEPNGGSGEYKFSLSTNQDKVRLSTNTKNENGGENQDTDNSTWLQVPYGISAGTHTYTVTVTDAKDSTVQPKQLNVTVVAETYYKSFGKASDSKEADLEGNTLYFYPVNATEESNYVQKVTYDKSQDGDVIIDSEYYENYTAVVGKSTEEKDKVNYGVGKGTYEAELAPGEYIVKIQSDVDNIKYQMSNHIVINPVAEQHPVRTPIRFNSVSGMAKSKSGAVLSKEKIYFETEKEQYESREYYYDGIGLKFSVETNEAGAFEVSLPANNYKAYILDENGNRCYFEQVITVTDEVNEPLNNFIAQIERYTVQGTVTVKDKLAEKEVRFYNAQTGEYRSTTTDKDGRYAIGLPGSVTYVVKANVDNVWQTINTVTLSSADKTENINYQLPSERYNASSPIYDGKSEDYSMKNGEVSAQFKCEKSGSYTFKAAVTDEQQTKDRMTLCVFDKDGNKIASESVDNKVSKVEIADGKSLNAGETYYIVLVPEIKSQNNIEQYKLDVYGQYRLTVSAQ